MISIQIMKFKFRQIGVIFGCLILALGLLSPPVYAEEHRVVDYSSWSEWPEAPETEAGAVYLMELGSGAVLYKKNENEKMYPASITKILTGLVVVENAQPDEMVTFSYNAVHDIDSGGFSYIADTNDQLSVEDCLYAMMLPSSNEAAYALAEHVGGSMSGFAQMMNDRAAELGATNSHFSNSHGLYAEDHYTTAHDMAMIMWGALENEDFVKYDSTLTYTTAPTKTQPDGYLCRMRHQMMTPGSAYYNSNVKAGKTGYIQAAQNTLVTYAEKDDLKLLCVVMRVDGAEKACEVTQSLLDYGFNNFGFNSISGSADLGMMEKTASAALNRVVQNFRIGDEAEVLIPNEMNGMEFDMTFRVDRDSLDGDTAYGKIIYSYNGIEVGEDSVEILLVHESQVEETEAEETKASRSLDEIFDADWLLIAFVSLIVLLLIFLLLMILLHNRKKNRKKRRN